MADFFFYGTLRHLPLLQIVLDRTDETFAPVAATLVDHGAFHVQDEPFPRLASVAGCRAQGILVTGLDETEVERLRFYESGFDFDFRQVTVELDNGQSAQAQVFFPDFVNGDTDQVWSLADWIADWGDISIAAAHEVMAWYRRSDTQKITAAFPGIRRRASAYVAGQKRPPDRERDLARDVIVRNHRHAYVNFFSMQEIDVQFRQYDGALSQVLNRGVVLVGEAAVLLPYDPVRDRVMLIEQFRAPVFVAGDRAPWIWEPVAGLLEPGEDAETAARREALEEAGLTLARLEAAGEMYSSTGSSTEYLHLFVGITDLGDDVTGTGGTDEGEDIRSRLVSYDDLMQGIDTGEYKDMPLITMGLWLARHRDRIRASA